MDELLLRQMPHSTEAEQAVLGSMLIDAACVKDVMDQLQPDDFYLRQNREIFETIYTMFVYSRPIDGLTVAGELEKAGLANDGTRAYLAQLMEVTPTSANVLEYVRLVREKALLRSVAAAAAEITAMVQEGTGAPGDVLEAAEQKIYAIRRGRSAQSMATIQVVLQEVMEHLAELSAQGGKTLPGLSTGFSAVDGKINGLNKSDLLLLAARPGMGKTSFALNLARNVAIQQHRTVAVFNLEMSREQMGNRLLSSEARVSSKKLRVGNLTPDEWGRIAFASSVLCKASIFLDDTASVTVPEMKARLRRLRGVDFVVVDYLQLMKSPRRIDNRVQEVTEITRGLKIMAKELNIPILVCAQLARSTEKQANHRPALADLRESGSIEQDADQVLFLYRDEYYRNEKEDPSSVEMGTSEVIVAKNRHGELGTVKLAWQGEFTQFTSLELHRSEG